MPAPTQSSLKVVCPRCSRNKLVPCPDCTQDPSNVPGHRALTGRRAFWDFVSKATRDRHDRNAFFPTVARRGALRDQLGQQIGIESARILSVEVKQDHVLVVANVVFGVPGQRNPSAIKVKYTTRWIREDGKFFVVSRADSQPEILLPDD